MFFRARNLQNRQKVVPLYCVFHSIRFKVNKGWAQRSPFFMSCRGGRYGGCREKIKGNALFLR